MRNHTNLERRAQSKLISPKNILHQFLFPDKLHSEWKVEISEAKVDIILSLLKFFFFFKHKCMHILHKNLTWTKLQRRNMLTQRNICNGLSSGILLAVQELEKQAFGEHSHPPGLIKSCPAWPATPNRHPCDPPHQPYPHVYRSRRLRKERRDY